MNETGFLMVLGFVIGLIIGFFVGRRGFFIDLENEIQKASERMIVYPVPDRPVYVGMKESKN